MIARFCLAAALLFAVSSASGAHPRFIFPKTSLGPEDIAVVVNDSDPESVKTGEYYQSRRGIPDANMIHVRFPHDSSDMTSSEFAAIKAQVDAKTPPSAQAFALAWTVPYRVDCMSMTSAFAFGFDKAYCSSCRPTKASAYFNSLSTMPFHDLKMRPAMMLAGRNFGEVKALIDRGIASDGTHPSGTGYLLSTSDKARNVRAAEFPGTVREDGLWVKLEVLEQDSISGLKDVLFYFTGAVTVPYLDTLHFLPGAIADHLTSTGGMLTDSGQMSILRWLDAGATASYGTVVEPCNYPQKFPDPGVAIFWYVHGESLIEAYWKSVAWPGEGVFVGEPLARPFDGNNARFDGQEVVLKINSLPPGLYALLGAESVVGPYFPEPALMEVRPGSNEFRLRNLEKPVYRVVRIH